MTNALYDHGREGILDRTIDMTAATITVALIRGGSFTSTHEFLSDLTGAGGSVVASAVLASKTETSGVFGAANVTFPAVASGTACSALVIYNDTGTGSTSRLVAWIDTATGLPVTPNGGDITVAWDTGSNKIFKL